MPLKMYKYFLTAALAAAVIVLTEGCSQDMTDKVVSKAEDAYSRIDAELTDDRLTALDGFAGSQAELLKDALDELYGQGISAERIVDAFTGKAGTNDPAPAGEDAPGSAGTGKIVEDITSRISDAAKEAAEEAVNSAADAAQEAAENAVQDVRDSVVDKISSYIDEVFD